MASDYDAIRNENIGKYGTETRHLAILGAMYSERTHFIFELLQNAEDAKATKIHFRLHPDRLEIQHDGRVFEETPARRDVRGICGVCESTNQGDLTRIGRFGIGFKSVYAYTDRPQVHSGDEHFRVEHYVRPYAEGPHLPDSGCTTLFVLPFGTERISAEQAFAEISKGLEELAPRTLLFLRHIELIVMEASGRKAGRLVRTLESEPEKHVRRIHLESSSALHDAEVWLILDRPVKLNGEHPHLRVEAAFLLHIDEDSKKESVVPVELSPLVVFFPTKLSTGLGFLIQGPFRTKPDRELVPTDEQTNKDLVRETATLVCDSLSKLKKLGLLNTAALHTLPIRPSDFPKTGMFRPIFDAVKSVLATQPLLPCDKRGWAKATELKMTRSSALRELLTPVQLQALFGTTHSIRWLAETITADRRDTQDLWTYLRDVLAIEELSPEKFAGHANANFFKQQTDQWLIDFYQFLTDQRSLWRAASFSWDSPGPLRQKPFIRTDDDKMVAPYSSMNAPQVWLPPAERTDFPVVKRTIAAAPAAQSFLASLGLIEPDVVEEVLTTVLPKYERDKTPTDKEHQQDLQKILRAFASATTARKQQLATRLAAASFLRAVNAVTKQIAYKVPASIYVRSAELELFFEGNAQAWFLSDDYTDERDQLFALGVRREVWVNASQSGQSGDVAVPRVGGPHQRGLNGFDPEATIDGLQHALNRISKAKAVFIWNTLLIPNRQHVSGEVETCTRANFVGAAKESRVSPIGRLVQSRDWLPRRDGTLHKPATLSVEDLPEEFRRNASLATDTLAKKLGMKSTVVATLAREAGIDAERVEFLRNPPREFEELFQKWKHQRLEPVPPPSHQVPTPPPPFDFPRDLQATFSRRGRNTEKAEQPSPGPIRNPTLYGQRVAEEILANRSNEPAPGDRVTIVSVTRWEPRNATVRDFLTQQYAGKCQICEGTFLKRDGAHYFEGVYLTSHTKAAWTDRPGNVLCLCANCSAKFQHGSIVADDFVNQVLALRTTKEGGDGKLMVRIELCGNEAKVYFNEAHLLEMRSLLET